MMDLDPCLLELMQSIQEAAPWSQGLMPEPAGCSAAAALNPRKHIPTTGVSLEADVAPLVLGLHKQTKWRRGSEDWRRMSLEEFVLRNGDDDCGRNEGVETARDNHNRNCHLGYSSMTLEELLALAVLAQELMLTTSS
jgi:hypothetical protein